MTLATLSEAIRIHRLDAKKSLGQHFLLDPAIVARIASLSGDMTARHVVEIGPGPGGLTRALLETNATAIHAVEIDQRTWPLLEELVAHANGRLHLVKADATKVDTAALCPAPRKIVANLPYNVGTPLLVGWLRQAALWERLTLMFQLEVAERICAFPDTPAYGRLSVLAQWCADCAIVMKVPARAFSPPPKVESALVDVVPKIKQPSPALFKAMEHVTHLAFGQRRKMLRASLKAIGGEALLDEAVIKGTRRAETLSVAEFDTLAKLVCQKN